MGPTEGEHLSDDLVRAPLRTRAGEPTDLAALTGGAPALVLFVRQFACAGCSEQIANLFTSLPALDALGAKAVVVGCGTPEQAEDFERRVGAAERGVAVVTDPAVSIQRALGLPRSAAGVWGPMGIFGLARAMLRGHPNGWSGGDFYQQGGALLLDAERRVLFFRPQRWLGDVTDVGDLVDRLLALAARAKEAS